MKKISIIGTVGLPGNYGGFESLVENLVLNQSGNIRYQVFCSKPAYKTHKKYFNGALLTYLPLKANGVQSIPYDVLSLISCIKRKPDVVLILGVSGCLFLPLYKLCSQSKIVTNIDGLEWKRDKWGYFTKRFLKLSERLAVRFSDVVVTDNQAITDYVHAEYGVDSTTIAYGGDHALRKTQAFTNQMEYAFALCRIEPENNIEMILESFSKVKMQLKFVGNWNRSEFGRSLKVKYGHFKNIDLLDPIYDLDELYKLRKGCALYLHGHSAGGTNPSLVEMMHFGRPIFAFDCSFNRYSTDNKAHYFTNVNALVELITRTTDTEKADNGNNMMVLAKKHYTWFKITKQYESVY
ncbi:MULTISPECIES: DUF1972 domain-containing protein [Photobacterium]|uniref:DUF1972 domain-containing protein n=1 Tax=Photobacterium chitinilyticum TaxID=2485123 RepID=A0A3S3S2L6_9GAMM|nr:DUF1972 domain-containing protein [Photobacterium chitinilyticum]RWX56624.1 DUF1972 domain-containing protein [Photobacterium chitinilyticum]